MSDTSDLRSQRERLARWLSGQRAPQTDTSNPQSWVDLSVREGVAAALHDACCNPASPSAVPPALHGPLALAARRELFYSMAFEAQTRRVVRHLERLGEPALLLKGVALGQWAYRQPHLRSCGDVDVLLRSREAANRLASALADDGFECAAPSGERVAYELMCQKPMSHDWTLEVDIHWQLTNSPLFARSFGFDELMAASQALPALGPGARGLGPVHAFLHAVLHRVLNKSVGIADLLKWQYDLVVMGKELGEAGWRQLVETATQKQLTGVVLEALQTTGETFGHRWPPAVERQLAGAARLEELDPARLDDWRYMQAQTMRSLPGLAPRLSWLWQRVFPSRDYMRYLYGENSSYARLLQLRARRAWNRLCGTG